MTDEALATELLRRWPGISDPYVQDYRIGENIRNFCASFLWNPESGEKIKVLGQPKAATFVAINPLKPDDCIIIYSDGTPGSMLRSQIKRCG